MRNRILVSALPALAALLLGSCRGSSAGLSLSLTDAPVDQASSIIIGIAYVTVSGDNVKPVSINYATALSKNIYAFQGGLSAPLFEHLPLTAGHYTNIRFGFAADQISVASTITLPDGVHVLYIPPGSPQYADVPVDFTISNGETINYTVDFDMRKSVIQDPNDSTRFIFIPQLRAVQNETVGTITGSVDTSLVQGLCTPAVYVYLETNGKPVTPTDENLNAPASEVQPLSSTLVGLNSTTGVYNFSVGFLPAGDYTVAFTCNADQDVANQDNGPTGTDTVFFTSVTTASVSALKVTQVSLQ